MSVTIVLECAHQLVFRYTPPKTGNRVYCVRCRDMRRVTGGHGDWRAVCDNCTFRRTRKTAEAIRDNIAQHLQNCPRHVVTLGQVGIEKTYKVQQQQPMTATGTDGAPILGNHDAPDTMF